MNKRPRCILAVKCILTVSLIVLILCIWPGYLFHEEYVSRTFCDRYEPSDILLPGDAATQYFVPQRSYLSEIEFIVLFNESYAGTGKSGSYYARNQDVRYSPRKLCWNRWKAMNIIKLKSVSG